MQPSPVPELRLRGPQPRLLGTLSFAETASRLNVCKATLHNLIRDGKAPPSYKLSRRRLFPIAAFEAWEAAKLAAERNSRNAGVAP